MAECKIPTKPSRVPSTATSTVTSATADVASIGVVAASGPSGSLASSSAAAAPVLVQEYSLRVPKTNTKPISIMRFNGALGVDPSKWTSVKMAREDNSKLHKTNAIIYDEDMPKFGAGSEYGREAREEARRRKYGMNKKKYNPEEQPWILKLGDKINRKYKGVREGGVSENASYFIFTQATDGAFEVFPVQQWYNFTPIQRYKSLTSEEAEEEYGRRNKIMNYFSVMVKKRMQKEGDADEEMEKVANRKAGKKNASSELKVSEMDDWADSDDEEMSDDGDDDDDTDKKTKKKAPKGKGQKKKKKGSDDEGGEDSDDGDEEGRELDYIDDTSETESEDEKAKKSDIQGVDQEKALRDLLSSGSESEENTEKKDEEEKSEDEPGPTSKNGEESETKDKKKKKKKKKKSEKKDTNNSENLSDEDEDKGDQKDEPDAPTSDAAIKIESGSSGNNSGNSRDGTPDLDSASGPSKRKASSDLGSLGSSLKKPKMEVSSVLLQSAAGEGITEEAVRRYLLRKPMTVTELLHKFKSKKTKISSHDMVNVIAHILKKINPVKRVQNQKMYLSLTANKS